MSSMKRIDWVDYYKALAIILVVLGHTGQFNGIIYQFQVAAVPCGNHSFFTGSLGTYQQEQACKILYRFIKGELQKDLRRIQGTLRGEMSQWGRYNLTHK